MNDTKKIVIEFTTNHTFLCNFFNDNRSILSDNYWDFISESNRLKEMYYRDLIINVNNFAFESFNTGRNNYIHFSIEKIKSNFFFTNSLSIFELERFHNLYMEDFTELFNTITDKVPLNVFTVMYDKLIAIGRNISIVVSVSNTEILENEMNRELNDLGFNKLSFK